MRRLFDDGGRIVGAGDRLTLAELLRRETVASMAPAEKAAALRGMRLYFQRPERPGFLCIASRLGPLVPVFTSIEGLARYAGVCGWASTTAEDLVELLPVGTRALVDPAGDTPFLLDSAVLAEMTGRTDVPDRHTRHADGRTSGNGQGGSRVGQEDQG